jgi:hypothetical protein
LTTLQIEKSANVFFTAEEVNVAQRLSCYRASKNQGK